MAYLYLGTRKTSFMQSIFYFMRERVKERREEREERLRHKTHTPEKILLENT
jgi:hypothetical protein